MTLERNRHRPFGHSYESLKTHANSYVDSTTGPVGITNLFTTNLYSYSLIGIPENIYIYVYVVLSLLKDLQTKPDIEA